MTYKEYERITKSPAMLKIEYQTAYSKGVIHIKKELYLKVMKKLSKAMKDAIIMYMEEYNVQ